MKSLTNTVATCALFSASSASAVILSGGPTGNTLQINQIVVEGVTLNSTTADRNQDNSPANLERLFLAGGDVVDTSTFNNPLTSVGGAFTPSSGFAADLGVFTGPGGATRLAFDPNTGTPTEEAAFLTAVQGAVETKNLRNYFDFNGVGGSENVELTFNYTNVIDPNGTIIIGERDGNSPFTLQALDSGGLVTGDLIEIEANSSAFAFDTGLGANAETQTVGQSMEIAIFEVSLFNATNPIQSIRLNNPSGADIFILASSQVIPEPSTYGLLLGIFAFCIVGSRRSRK